MTNNRSWEYALNMAGSEMMMLTNRELVANISSYPGKIFTESYLMPEKQSNKTKYKWVAEEPLSPDHWPIIKKIAPNDPPPFNLTIYKGAKAWKAPRAFIKFLLEHHVAKTYLGRYYQV